jgi:hypothetical protein
MALSLPLGVQRPRPIVPAPRSNKYAGYKRASKGPTALSTSSARRTIVP